MEFLTGILQLALSPIVVWIACGILAVALIALVVVLLGLISDTRKQTSTFAPPSTAQPTKEGGGGDAP